MSRSDLHLFEVPQFALHQPNFHLSREVLWFERQQANRRFTRDESGYFSDPLYEDQWHLHDGPEGNDLQVEGAWDLGYSGEGVLVSIVDDGLDYNNLDVLDHYCAEASYDVGDNDDDPMPASYDQHGSQAGSTATAIANNEHCGVGVAPGAITAGVRLLVGEPTDFQEAEALQFRNDIVDIYSSSWGPYDDGTRLEGPGPLTMAAFENSTRVGRSGKGSIFVWAGGNGLRSKDNTNYDGFANQRYTIAIGAVGRDGTQTYYSEPGACLVAVTPSSDNMGNNIFTSGPFNSCKTTFGGTSAAW